jgi:hypothetical protein
MRVLQYVHLDVFTNQAFTGNQLAVFLDAAGVDERKRSTNAPVRGVGSEGNAQPASGACAIAVPASAPARIVAENSVRSIFSPSPIAGNARDGPACRAGYL